MDKHTPEPWKTEYRKDSRGMFHQDIFDVNGETIAVMSWYPVKVSETKTETNREANARRIVACVNACAGMDDPQIAISKLGYERDKAREERNIADTRIAELEAELAAEREKVELLREALVAFESWWRLPNKQRTIETIESPMRLCIEALAATEPPCKK